MLRNEYLVAENQILRAQINGRLLLLEAEKKILADIGHRLGRKALEEVANAAKTDTHYGLVSRRVEIAGITPNPHEAWMKQIARNVTMDEWGFLEGRRYLIHDRDAKFTDTFRTIIKSSHIESLKLPARSPNLNANAERWVRSVKEEALSKLILLGEASLRRVLREYVTHFHEERNHQGRGKVLLFPSSQEPSTCRNQAVCCRERLGGLLNYYHRQVA